MIGSLLLSVSALHGAASYIRYPLHELAALADRVVVGTIEALQEETFDLAVEETLVGGPQASLRLPKFQDWTCAGRYAPYRVGQRVLLFLRQGRVMGAGDEGEMPLVGKGVLVPYSVRGSRYVERPIEGCSLRSSWVPLADIAGALADYRASFDFRPAERFGLTVGGTRLRASADALDELRGRSSFARELIEVTLNCRCVRGHEVAPEEALPAGLVGARSLRRNKHWTLQDGAEHACFHSLAVYGRGDPLEVVTGNPATARVSRLLFLEDATVSEVEHLDAGQLGWRRDRLPFGPPDFGAGLAVLDDLDGDGRGELAVSAPALEYEHDEEHVCALYVVSWPRGQVPRLLHVLRAAEAPQGLLDGCDFGRALCAPGDLDGDGRAELVASRNPDHVWKGSRRERPSSSLAVLFLDLEGRVRDWRAIVAQDVGFDAGHGFGGALAGPGDVDGDGVPDLVLGEPLAGTDGPYRGALRVVFLTDSGEVRGWKRIDAGTAPELALEPGDEFGASLGAAGDLDGDGVPDLVVGGARALWSVFLAQDGSVKSARRQALESLFPTAVQAISLARPGRAALGTTLFLGVILGTRRPFDVGLARLRVEDEGRLTVD